MHIYVWKCAKCDVVVEELRKIGEDEPPVSCECGAGDFKKQLTSANFTIDPAAGRSKTYKAPEEKTKETKTETYNEVESKQDG